MNLSKFFSAVIYLTFSVSSFGQLPVNEMAVELIKSDLLVFTKTLSREIRTYHWNNLQDVQKTLEERINPENITLKDPKIISFANKWSEGFWLNQYTNGDMGWGLYTATTPTSSIEWRCADWLSGRECENWILLEISFPEQTRFLDIRFGHNQGFKFSKKTITFLKSEFGCTMAADKYIKKDGVDYFTFRKSVISASPCFKHISQAIKDLKIAFVVYGWFNETAFGCDLPLSRVGIILADSKLSANNLTVFSSKFLISDDEAFEYSRIRGQLEELGEKNIMNNNVTATFSDQEYFYCKNKSTSPEERVSN